MLAVSIEGGHRAADVEIQAFILEPLIYTTVQCSTPLGKTRILVAPENTDGKVAYFKKYEI